MYEKSDSDYFDVVFEIKSLREIHFNSLNIGQTNVKEIVSLPNLIVKIDYDTNISMNLG